MDDRSGARSPATPALSLIDGGRDQEDRILPKTAQYLAYAPPLRQHHLQQACEQMSDAALAAIESVLVSCERTNNQLEAERVLEVALVLIRSAADYREANTSIRAIRPPDR